MHIQISLSVKSYFEQTFSIFGTNLPEKDIYGRKQKDWKSEWIPYIRITLGTKFQPKLAILNVWTKLIQKKFFLVQNRKREHHHWNLHVPISLDTKFQLKLTIYTKIYFQSKTEKVNITMEFYIYESVSEPIFSLNWIFSFFGPNLPKKSISTRKKDI